MSFWSTNFWAPGFWNTQFWGEDAPTAIASAALAAFTITGDPLEPLLPPDRPAYVLSIPKDFDLKPAVLGLVVRGDTLGTFSATVRPFSLTGGARPWLLEPVARTWTFDPLNSEYQFLGVPNENTRP